LFASLDTSASIKVVSARLVLVPVAFVLLGQTSIFYAGAQTKFSKCR